MLRSLPRARCLEAASENFTGFWHAVFAAVAGSVH